MAYAEQAMTAAPKPASATSSIEDFDGALSRLEQLVQRTSVIADRVCGSRPNAVASNDKAPSPNHLIFAIQARRDRAVSAIDRLEDEIGRLEIGIG